MFKSRTLFVIGAGASAEVGLPVGDQLREDISKRVDIRFSHSYTLESGDQDICETLRRISGGKINDYLPACWKIRDGIILANSIDNFIDSHRQEPKIQICGKLSIVQAIIEAERRSQLFFDSRNPGRDATIKFREIQESYFIQMWRILQEGVSVEDVDSLFSNVSFVTFNYDRCLEHFLLYALQRHYFVEEECAAEILSTIPIYHPYGTVGKLPWQDAQNSVPYGGTEVQYRRYKINDLADQINTYTEKFDDTAALQAMRSAVDEAVDVVFLGFGYFEDNMRLLTKSGVRNPRAKRVFGTAYGLSESDISVITEQIRDLYPACDSRLIQIRRDLTCGGLFREFGRTLTNDRPLP